MLGFLLKRNFVNRMNTPKTQQFDVIIVGGGHAGIEAAYAAAKMGSRTLLITLDVDKIGIMPCNPAIGGIGKGHIVYEISALGGLMPQLCTKTYLQARMLNTRKGPAVQGLRLQIDKFAYNKLSSQVLQNTDNLTIYSGVVKTITTNDNQAVTGVITEDGTVFHSPTVVITTGTFLNGKIHIGEHNYAAGRRDEQAVTGLSQSLRSLHLKMGRLKTGTPPRLLRSSLDFSQMEYQEADNLNYLFEFSSHKVTNSHPCYITHTNEQTHTVIRNNLHRSAMYNGNIIGIGPRYCPSIEDKIGRFPDKSSHHVFVEPEGAQSEEIYPNGISTSLPIEVQLEYVRTIAGFQDAIIVHPGYAVEYDFVLPNQLSHSLEVKTISGLFLAGQINGTTGYEEAAGQGIIAGINASLKSSGKEPFIMDRSSGYIGIMIDDLVRMGVDEPYRMFTSRAEYRLSLRQDNSFTRLMHTAYNLGLITTHLYQEFQNEEMLIAQTLTELRAGNTTSELLNLLGQEHGTSKELLEKITKPLSDRSIQTIHAELRYEPYLKREAAEVEKRKQYQNLEIPENLIYTNMSGLSKELQTKLNKIKPTTIAQAALIPGMTPAALSLLIFKSRKKDRF